jgi:hypothetical protein
MGDGDSLINANIPNLQVAENTLVRITSHLSKCRSEPAGHSPDPRLAPKSAFGGDRTRLRDRKTSHKRSVTGDRGKLCSRSSRRS